MNILEIPNTNTQLLISILTHKLGIQKLQLAYKLVYDPNYDYIVKRLISSIKEIKLRLNCLITTNIDCKPAH